MRRMDDSVVLKFGGATVADARRLRAAATLTGRQALRSPVVVVVSAMAGVTDTLLLTLAAAAEGRSAWRDAVAGLERLHRAALATLSGSLRSQPVAQALGERLHTLSALLEMVERGGRCSPGVRAHILASGERMSSILMASALRIAGFPASVVDGSELIVTSGEAPEGSVDSELTRSRIRRRLGQVAPGTIPVVTGFIAGDPAGRTTLLGRGGSDFSATLVAAALEAARVEIWTDVPGVLSAPPRWVPEARTVPRLSRSEAAALARWGGRVLHPRTLEPLERTGTELMVASSLEPGAGRTTVAGTRPAGRPVAISGRGGVALVKSGRAGRAVLDPGDGRRCGFMMETGRGSRSIDLGLAAIALIGGGEPALALESARSLRLPVLGFVPELEPGTAGLIVREHYLRRTVKILHDLLILGYPGRRPAARAVGIAREAVS